MDASSTKYRIRQCSECSDGLEYFCVTCSRDLCLECREGHVVNFSAMEDAHTVINYREKSNYLKEQELCLRHPNSVYDNYCEVCKTPICPDCTEHRTHKKTDVRTAYVTKRRQTKKIIKKIEEDEILCGFLWYEIEIDFKVVSENAANTNSELLSLSNELTGYIDSLQFKFPDEIRCLKQKNKMKRCIASTQIYEHIYEHSSIASLKFLLSVKKIHNFKMNNRNVLKHHCKATYRESTSMECLIEKLPTIKLTSQENRIQSTTSDMGLLEKFRYHLLTRERTILKSPQLMLIYCKCCEMLYSKYPMLLQGVIEYG